MGLEASIEPVVVTSHHFMVPRITNVVTHFVKMFHDRVQPLQYNGNSLFLMCKRTK